MKKIIVISLLVTTALLDAKKTSTEIVSQAVLLHDQEITKLADSVYNTVSKEKLFTEKAAQIDRDKMVSSFEKDFPALTGKSGLNVKIVKKTVDRFMVELNGYLSDKKYINTGLTVDQYAPINNCLQEIKNGIPEDKQLALAIVPFQQEEAAKVRSTLEDLQGKVNKLLGDTQQATTEEVNSLLAKTQAAVREEASALAREVKSTAQELKQNFFESLVSSIAKFFGVKTTPVVTELRTQKSPVTNSTHINTRTGHRRHGAGRR